ncbi:methyl-accepting chemotaxis protein [Cohnella sp. GCM10020058]|uniref:methyl-accepting chemotaxis protein n=1 Tax=Cohnella sp. GCM10020058 TaxID=3317330 RepID=UPI003627D293
MRNLKLSGKLAIIIVIALVFILTVGLGGNQMTRTMAGNVEDSYTKSLLPLSWLRQIQTNERSVDAYTLELMLISDSAARQAKLSKIQQLLTETDALIDQYASIVKDDAMLSELADYMQLLTSYRDVQAKAGGQALQGDGEGAYAIYADDTGDLREQMTQALASLAEQTQQAADDLYAQSQKDARINSYITAAMIVAALVLLSVVSWLMSRAITKPLGALRDRMKRAAAGDMTVSGDYRSLDEIGELTSSFNDMIAGIRELAAKASDGAAALSGASARMQGYVSSSSNASERIAIAAGQLSTGFLEQNDAVTGLTEATDRMAVLLTGVESDSRQVQAMSEEAATAGVQGLEAVKAAMHQMEEIQRSVFETQATIRELGDRSDEIGFIVTTIEEMAGHTNLLALNATIEAARAGEAGRGFAVVSDEIRKLADDASRASRRIAEMVKSIQQETGRASAAMDEEARRVRTGVDRTGQAAASFRDIERAIRGVKQKLAEVADSSTEAMDSSRHVAGSMKLFSAFSAEGTAGIQEMSAESEGQSRMMREAAASVDELNLLAAELRLAIGKFELGEAEIAEALPSQ